jgi:hypothetical protein
VTAALWRAFATRTFVIWLALHLAAAVAIALAAAATDLPPSGDTPLTGVWMITMTATLLWLDIARTRERLLLHDLGVRLRVLIPLAVVPSALAEALYIALT